MANFFLSVVHLQGTSDATTGDHFRDFSQIPFDTPLSPLWPCGHPTRFHRAFGRGVLWASSDSSWVCWAWLSYYILHLKPLGAGWAKGFRNGHEKKTLSLFVASTCTVEQVLMGFATKPTEESTDRSSPIPRIHQRQSLDPEGGCFLMVALNELLNNSTSSARMIQEDAGNH